MKLTLKQIESFKPCADRINNFKELNPTLKEFTVNTFLSLDSITYSDKIWVMTRIMSKNQKIQWAVACAWSVLSLFEKKYPNDKRPRELLEYMNTIDDYSILTGSEMSRIRELRNAANAAANVAYAAYAYVAYAADAANAAANAAYAYAANVAYAADAYAADAANAAANAAYAYAANVAYAADAYAKKTQEDLNLMLLIEVLGK